jgi:tetratricopeptide (TPR) repeat protein
LEILIALLLYEQTKEYDLARDCYRRLAANFPERPEFMVKHAMMLIKLKDFSAAEKSLDTLFRFHPGHIDGHRILGEMYCSTGRFKLAIEEFKRTLLINEDFIPGILGLAAVYKETENHEQEYETLKIAVEKGRETAEIIFRLGEIERKLKMPASMDRFKRVRELAPETSYAQEAEYYIRHQAA